MISTWNIAAAAGGSPGEEQLLAFDRGRASRVLVCPAWFDEANRLRRFSVEVMRRLDQAGIDSLLPDLPGCNESLAPLAEQSLEGWRQAMAEAARSLGATHVLALRAGALIAPDLPGWLLAPQPGAKLLRAMLRARILADREAGMSATSESLLACGRTQGLVLGGWHLGAGMVRALETAEPAPAPGQTQIALADLGGGALWLRAEPGEDPGQADRLTAIIAGALA